jgi:Polyketide cyclase / dehydrase and lipid transport
MTSTVDLEINAPQAQLAQLLADPNSNPRWMDDIEKVEPVSGWLGEPGSKYRLVPKRGNTVFVATVVKRALPTELTLSLDEPRVSVLVQDRFLKLTDRKTRLISEEVFTFKSAFGRIVGFFSQGAIKAAHRRHMESFKRFAESH